MAVASTGEFQVRLDSFAKRRGRLPQSPGAGIRGTSLRLLRQRLWQRYACGGVMFGVRVGGIVNVEGRSL
jgi:hypothetical protein